MEKRKSEALCLCASAGIGFGIYLVSQPILALMILKGYLSEESAGGLQVFLGGAAAFAGGIWAVRRLPDWGRVFTGLLVSALMAAAAVLAGVLLYDKLVPDTAVIRLAAMAAGGILAGVIGAGQGGQKRRRKTARGGKRIKRRKPIC